MLFISHVTGHICANLTSANFHFQISKNCNTQFSSVQSLSHVQLFETPWTAARQASLSITNSQSLLKLIAIESVMPSNHVILYHPILLPTWIFPSIRVFSNESVLCIRWSKYWSFSFNINPSSAYSGFISLGWTGRISLQSKGLSRVFSDTTQNLSEGRGRNLQMKVYFWT